MFQHYCILCDAHAATRDLCALCHADLPWLGPACRRCARPLPAAAATTRCGRCLRRPPLHAATRAALRYEFPVDQLLLKLKFGNALPPGRVLGELLAEVLVAVPAAPVDMLVPVPLHPGRLRERGFNQALEIARPVARALALPLAAGACRRRRETAPQSTLTGADRRRNVADAFRAEPCVAGRCIAVIDDVYTSGNTLRAVAGSLLRAGARRVDAWCVARGGVN